TELDFFGMASNLKDEKFEVKGAAQHKHPRCHRATTISSSPRVVTHKFPWRFGVLTSGGKTSRAYTPYPPAELARACHSALPDIDRPRAVPAPRHRCCG